MDCLVDTNVLLRSANRLHPASSEARGALKRLFREGYRLCVARQNLLEAWVVATRPMEVNGFGYAPAVAAAGLSTIKRLFHVLAEVDEIYGEWERLVVRHQVRGKGAHDTRLAATMAIHGIDSILTYNGDDFRRYPNVRVLHPGDVMSAGR